MSPTETLKTENNLNWSAAINHPFCRDLADGSLPPEKMSAYLQQDYTFIDAFVRLAASAIAQAPSLADSVPLAQFLAVITGPENTYFLRSFETLGVNVDDQEKLELWDETAGFQSLMKEAAASGKYENMIAVLVVAEWIYLSWATPYNPPKDGLPFYLAEWITLHSGPDFEAVITYLRNQLDSCWHDLGLAEKETVSEFFRRAVSLEKQFFDRAYL